MVTNEQTPSQTHPYLSHPLSPPYHSHPAITSSPPTISTIKCPLHAFEPLHSARRPRRLRYRSRGRRRRIRQTSHLPHSGARPRHCATESLSESIYCWRVWGNQGRRTNQKDESAAEWVCGSYPAGRWIWRADRWRGWSWMFIGEYDL